MNPPTPPDPAPAPMPRPSVLLNTIRRLADLPTTLVVLDALYNHFMQPPPFHERFKRSQISGKGQHQHLKFLLDWNPDRALRNVPRVKTPPPGVTSVNEDCPLCLENVGWMSSYRQPVFPLELPSGQHAALTSPWPLGEIHHTIVSTKHTPQDWRSTDPEVASAALISRMQDVTRLAWQLRDYLVFHNGAGAGASLPRHAHHQVLHRWDGIEEWAIESALREIERMQGRRPFAILSSDDYPVAALVFTGSEDEVWRNAGRIIRRWVFESALPDRLTCNLLAFRNSGPAWGDRLTFFLIPRSEPPPGDQGRAVHAIGSLELSGELVCGTREEMDEIGMDGEGFRHIWKKLAGTQNDAARSSVLRLYTETLPPGTPPHVAASPLSEEIHRATHQLGQTLDQAEELHTKVLEALQKSAPRSHAQGKTAAARGPKRRAAAPPAVCSETWLELKPETVKVKRGGISLKALTPEGANVLRVLASKRHPHGATPGAVLPPLTRHEIVEGLMRLEPDFRESKLNERICRIRKLFAEQGFGNGLIRTILEPASGYQLMMQQGHVTP